MTRKVPQHTRRTKSGVVVVRGYTAYTAGTLMATRSGVKKLLSGGTNFPGASRIKDSLGQINLEVRRRTLAANARARQIQLARKKAIRGQY